MTIHTADIILLQERVHKTSLLLIKRRKPPFEGMWALPGGKQNEDEGIIETAVREMREETGLEVRWLYQVGIFDQAGRDPRGDSHSTAFIACQLMEEDATPRAGDDASDAQWFPLDALPEPLAFDHAEIIACTLRQLVTCEACSRKFHPEYGYCEDGEYAYCAECCHW